MTPTHELVARIADVLRSEVAPAVDGVQPRSQAFRASAVLRRVARRLELAEAHAAAESEDRRLLAADLTVLLADVDAPGVTAALAALAALAAADTAGYGPAADAGHKAGLARLVDAVHADRDRMSGTEFEQTLARVRRALRADLDRDLDVAR